MIVPPYCQLLTKYCNDSFGYKFRYLDMGSFHVERQWLLLFQDMFWWRLVYSKIIYLPTCEEYEQFRRCQMPCSSFFIYLYTTIEMPLVETQVFSVAGQHSSTRPLSCRWMLQHCTCSKFHTDEMNGITFGTYTNLPNSLKEIYCLVSAGSWESAMK